jgi:MoaA/NifB/PqqE/SkfB family radical SAM enzyme
METPRVKKMIKFVGKNWSGAPLIFFGGEPTLRNDLPECIEACVDSGIKPVVISNGQRVLFDEKYTKRLVNAGLSNWTSSIDGYVFNETVCNDIHRRAYWGLKALRKMRDEYGIRDLVAVITVTRSNISILPEMVRNLTFEGIWSTLCVVQLGGKGYEYSQGSPRDLPSRDQIFQAANILYGMASSGQYLMHNGLEWFEKWFEPDTVWRQDWKCSDKACLTVDADGYLRYCVDIPFRKEERLHILDLESEQLQSEYVRIMKGSRPCEGCMWDTQFEMINRNNELGEGESRRSFRHEIDDEKLSKLIPEARHWFIGNPTLKPVR